MLGGGSGGRSGGDVGGGKVSGGAGHDAGGGKVAVDFCGGQGHVGLLLAHLFPDWDVVCVDNKQVRARVYLTDCV